MTLSHRINRTRSDPQSKPLAEKFYLYWGLAVRSLNEQLDVQDRQTSDLVMAGIMTLLLADVSACAFKYGFLLKRCRFNRGLHSTGDVTWTESTS
jgi:hypothetical protein